LRIILCGGAAGRRAARVILGKLENALNAPASLQFDLYRTTPKRKPSKGFRPMIIATPFSQKCAGAVWYSYKRSGEAVRKRFQAVARSVKTALNRLGC
jgi:hypothetical protein